MADKERRMFLTFSNTSNIDNTDSKEDFTMSVSTDISGHYQWLADISFDEFVRVLPEHHSIVNTNWDENRKLQMLVDLWQPINPRISGYLFGDIDG